MRKLALFVGAALLMAAPVMAQDKRAEIFGGYSYARINPGGLAGNEMDLNGWNAAVQGNLTSWFGVVGDFSGHYGSRAGADVSTHQALFGPRVTLPAGSFRPFAHALFGVARGNAGLFGSTDAESAFGMAVGGGVDIGSGVIAWRLIQADYLMTRFNNARRDNARLSTGIVLRF